MAASFGISAAPGPDPDVRGGSSPLTGRDRLLYGFTAIELVRDDGDRVLGVHGDRAHAEGPGADRGRPKASRFVEADIIAQEEGDVGLTEVLRVAEIRRAPLEHVRCGRAEIRDDLLEVAVRHGHARPDVDEPAGALAGAGERLLCEHGETALVWTDESGIATRDTQDSRRASASSKDKVHDRFAPDAVRDEEGRAYAPQSHVEPAAPGQIVEPKVARRDGPAADDDEPTRHAESFNRTGAIG